MGGRLCRCTGDGARQATVEGGGRWLAAGDEDVCYALGVCPRVDGKSVWRAVGCSSPSRRLQGSAQAGEGARTADVRGGEDDSGIYV
jgi:hypothetical protein